MSDPVTGLVVALFSRPGVALWLAAAILAFAVYLVVSSAILDQGPLVRALVDRTNLLFADGGRKGFAGQFKALDQRFSSAASPPALVRGWKAYKALLTREEDGGLAAAFPAAEVFEPLDDPARALEWWANILVAIGLMITFMGIVAALSEATAAIAAGGGAGGAEQALLGLLAIAATKFWTSIAGVLSSILLRMVARRRRQRIEALQADLFQALDSSVNFAPPERVMFDQLAVLRRIEALLAGGQGRPS